MTATTGAARRAPGAGLRARAKMLPAHTRAHHRSMVLQHLFHAGPTSRADLARATGLTRVTVSDLVAALLAEGLLEERGVRKGGVGKPATLVGMRTEEFQVVALDLSDEAVIRGAVLTLTADAVERRELHVGGRTGGDLVDLVAELARGLLAAATRPVLGVGLGSPGVVDRAGRVVEAPNLRWADLPLAAILTERLGLPVHVANDADTAALGEYTYGGADDAALVLTVGQGVGAGIILDGARVHGAGDAAGELGHVTVVDDGAPCACGRRGCLETLLAVPALRRAVAGLDAEAADEVLAGVGRVLGTALAPVVSALNLGEVLLSGPADLLDGALREATTRTLRDRTMRAVSARLAVRTATLGEDGVLAGAAVLVLAAQLGVS